MSGQTINEELLKKLEGEYPQFKDLEDARELFWINPACNYGEGMAFPFGEEDVAEAEARLQRFAPYLRKAFPETEAAGGIIESPIAEIPDMRDALAEIYGVEGKGRLLVKLDSELPVSGSIKARGGIYEVLKLAEEVARKEGMLSIDDDYSILTEDRFKELFSKYSVAVGSTGNLGLSIGIMSAKLGFHVTIHMSADARQWKKDMLREKGAIVVEYPDDYEKAVAEGRRQAAADPMCHFVDDESSEDLFLGYTTAAGRLKKQLEDLKVTVDEEHPLFVYLPCGVGGGPGGVAFGLHLLYGKNVHCFFAEPTQAPCMTVGLMTNLHNEISCGDIGLSGKTAADGLAVGRCSALVSRIMQPLLDGCFTVEDDELYLLLKLLMDTEDRFIEPSSCAAFPGYGKVLCAAEYLEKSGLADKMANATHIAWATGGSMVPKAEAQSYYDKGAVLSEE